MNNKRNIRKRLIALGLALLIILGIIIGAVQYMNYRNDQKTITVVPAYYALQSYYGSSSTTEGTIVSDYVQELRPDSSKSISEIFVQEGQQVSVGDPLLQYDKTSLELDVEAKEIAQKQVQVRIDEAQRILKKLQNTKPSSTPRPTTRPTATVRPRVTPTPRPTTRPTASPTPTPAPTPTPFPTPDPGITAYKELDVDSIPYKGFGTTESPYVFLCQEGFTMTPGFLRLMLGLQEEPAVTPEPPVITPEPTEPAAPVTEPPQTDEPTTDPTVEPTPDGSGSSSEPETGGMGYSAVEAGELTIAQLAATATSDPETQLRSPFAGTFEIREHNSNYGKVISSFTMDGTKLSAAFNLPGLAAGNAAGTAAAAAASARIRNEVESQYRMATATPKPTPEPNNYNHMNYTSADLTKLINDKKREITNLQYELKQAQLNLEISQQALSNSTVTSSLDGIVSRLTDIETAITNGEPFLVVSGAQQYYISSSLNESMIGQVNVGDIVSFMSYGMTGMANYSAEIVSISDYPLTETRYYGGENNPNSSNYEFTAVILNPDDAIQTGNWGQITLDGSVQSTDSYGVETKYLSRAYFREDDSGNYVMLAGKDNRLHKQYVQLGKRIPWGEDYYELLGGMTQDDFIAFPYSADAKEGVRVILEDTKEPPYPDGSEDELEPTGSGVENIIGGVESGLEDLEDALGGAEDETGSSAESGIDSNGEYFETDGGGDAAAMPASPGNLY